MFNSPCNYTVYTVHTLHCTLHYTLYITLYTVHHSAHCTLYITAHTLQEPVVRIIEQLPDTENCTLYQFKHHPPAKLSSWYDARKVSDQYTHVVFIIITYHFRGKQLIKQDVLDQSLIGVVNHGTCLTS